MTETEFLDPKAAAKRLGTTVGHLTSLRGDGIGPPYHKIGKLVRYSESDLRSYLAETKVNSREKPTAIAGDPAAVVAAFRKVAQHESELASLEDSIDRCDADLREQRETLTNLENEERAAGAAAYKKNRKARKTPAAKRTKIDEAKNRIDQIESARADFEADLSAASVQYNEYLDAAKRAACEFAAAEFRTAFEEINKLINGPIVLQLARMEAANVLRGKLHHPDYSRTAVLGTLDLFGPGNPIPDGQIFARNFFEANNRQFKNAGPPREIKASIAAIVNHWLDQLPESADPHRADSVEESAG